MLPHRILALCGFTGGAISKGVTRGALADFRFGAIHQAGFMV